MLPRLGAEPSNDDPVTVEYQCFFPSGFALGIVEALSLGNEEESYGKRVNIEEADYASVYT